MMSREDVLQEAAEVADRVDAIDTALEERQYLPAARRELVVALASGGFFNKES